MTIQILNNAIMIVEAFMGTKQGLVKLSPKREVFEIGTKFGLNKSQLMVLGIVTLITGFLFLLPATFNAGNFLIFSIILFAMCYKLEIKNLSEFTREVPFFAMNLMMLYMQYPLQDVKER